MLVCSWSAATPRFMTPIQLLRNRRDSKLLSIRTTFLPVTCPPSSYNIRSHLCHSSTTKTHQHSGFFKQSAMKSLTLVTVLALQVFTGVHAMPAQDASPLAVIKRANTYDAIGAQLSARQLEPGFWCEQLCGSLQTWCSEVRRPFSPFTPLSFLHLDHFT